MLIEKEKKEYTLVDDWTTHHGHCCCATFGPWIGTLLPSITITLSNSNSNAFG